MASDTRLRILEAAARLFAERGFDGTSIADVLERARVLSGSLYHFFPGKEALGAAVLEEWGRHATESALDAAEESAADPLARVLALLEHLRSDADGATPALGAASRLAADLASRRPELAGVARRHGELLVTKIRDWLDQAGPRLPPGTDRSGLARFVVLVAEGAAVRARFEGAAGPFNVATAQLRSYLAALEDAAAGRRAVPETARVESVEPAPPSGPSGDPTGWRAW